MKADFSSLHHKHFDCLVIGGGINGASVTKDLSVAGYKTILAEKEDFGSGSSSRSSRLIHCGLRHLAPGGSAWRLSDPRVLCKTLKSIRSAMNARSDLVCSIQNRVKPFRMIFPLFTDSGYYPWQMNAAFTLLGIFGNRKVPLNYTKYSKSQITDQNLPFVPWLRDQDKIRGASVYTEYQMDWPERIIADMVLASDGLGADICNYTKVVSLSKVEDGWKAVLENKDVSITVYARAVINTSGIWIDQVNGLTGRPVQRKVLGTKGAHVVVKLPSACRGHGIACINRMNEPFYCMPWRDLHFFGPTETVYEGSLDDIHATKQDVEFILGEVNHLFPELNITSRDILFTWAGVRPLTYNPSMPKGERSRTVHDLSKEGAEGMYALTNGGLSSHRISSSEIVQKIKQKLGPGSLVQKSRLSSSNAAAQAQDSTILMAGYPEVTVEAIQSAAKGEHVRTLGDILHRRTGAVWTSSQALDVADKAAELVAPILGWDDERRSREVAEYMREVADLYPKNPD